MTDIDEEHHSQLEHVQQHGDGKKYHQLGSPKDDWELDDLLEKHSDTGEDEEEPEKKSWKKVSGTFIDFCIVCRTSMTAVMLCLFLPAVHKVRGPLEPSQIRFRRVPEAAERLFWLLRHYV